MPFVESVARPPLTEPSAAGLIGSRALVATPLTSTLKSVLPATIPSSDRVTRSMKDRTLMGHSDLDRNLRQLRMDMRMKKADERFRMVRERLDIPTETDKRKKAQETAKLRAANMSVSTRVDPIPNVTQPLLDVPVYTQTVIPQTLPSWPPVIPRTQPPSAPPVSPDISSSVSEINVEGGFQNPSLQRNIGEGGISRRVGGGG